MTTLLKDQANHQAQDKLGRREKKIVFDTGISFLLIYYTPYLSKHLMNDSIYLTNI